MKRLLAWLVAALSTIGMPYADGEPLQATQLRSNHDALYAVEISRAKIVARMLSEHAQAMADHGVPLDAFRAALWSLPPDRLLAASLADSTEAVNDIVSASAATPVTREQLKDGPGSGPNSWIGYTGGANVASGDGSAVAAGTNNVASGLNSFVGAGTYNFAGDQGAFVGAGTSNAATAISTLVIGGFDNQATKIDALVVAGAGNRATGARSVVVGGGYNLASGQWSFIGGGGRQHAVVGGAGTSIEDNVASGDFSTIGGGQANLAGAYAMVGGGYGNKATAIGSTVAGGWLNTAGGFGGESTVGGGNGNVATGAESVIAGGASNTASGDMSNVGGGQDNIASGQWSTVAGGQENRSMGAHSFAAGHRARPEQDYCALFGLWSTSIDFSCYGFANIFRIGADHGFSVEYSSQQLSGSGARWVAIGDTVAGRTITTWNGGYLSDSGIWTNNSDRNAKEDFTSIDPREVLQRLAAMSIQTWRYKHDRTAALHLGPVAQDFHAAFGLGDNERAIGTLDESGVALAAIQGLNQELEQTRQALRLKEERVDRLERELIEIKAKLGL